MSDFLTIKNPHLPPEGVQKFQKINNYKTGGFKCKYDFFQNFPSAPCLNKKILQQPSSYMSDFLAIKNPYLPQRACNISEN